MCPSKHPDCKRKFEVRVRDHAVLVKHALDCFLRPRSILLGNISAYDLVYDPTPRAIISHRKLSGHDQLHCLLNGFRMGVPGVHESHGCPARLHHLSIFVFNPLAKFASLETHMTSKHESASVTRGIGTVDLVTFPPSSVFSLFRKQKITRTSDSRAVRVILSAKC